ncbi:MAG: glutathione synthase [Myxococcales bacterium]|nr:glutathione synthase [Myxococcales bacterium]
MKILFIVDELSKLDLGGDTSYALMLESAARGHELWTCQVGHLGLEGNDAVATALKTTAVVAAPPAQAFTCGASQTLSLSSFGAVFMRADPPLNVEYLHATWILDHGRGKTVLVNDPRGLREHNEHLSILAFQEFIPPTIVTRSAARLEAFLAEHDRGIILKPVDGFGGMGIFLVQEGDPNTSSIFETSTQGGQIWTMAQSYLPAARLGDKRIVLVEGEPIGAVMRVPPEGEARGNLHVGGRADKTDLTEREVEIIAAVSPVMKEYGQILVGLDVIGDMLTEINITSPTGIRHISQLDGINAATPVLECVEEKAMALGFTG